MKRRIHIQHVVLSLQPGGLENGVVNVVNHLNNERFRSSVCCLKRAGEFSSRIKSPEVSISQFGWRGGIDLYLPLRLARHFHQSKTDIVHTRNSAAFLYGFLGAKIAGIDSIVHSEHGQVFDETRLRYLMQRLFSRYTDAIFAVSETLKRDLVTHIGFPASKLGVIHNGVDRQRFLPTNCGQIRQQLGLNCDAFVVGSVGRLVPVKNYQLLIRAVKSLGIENVAIIMIGDGPDLESLSSLAQSVGLKERVRFLGHQDDVAGLLEAMDVFVLPSSSEGMSNTLLEAMAAGVAVVASNVGGTPEIIRDRIDGLLFESGDEAGLRDCLQCLLINVSLRSKLAESGRQRVLQHFSIESMIAQYEHLYLSTLNHSQQQFTQGIQKAIVRVAAVSHLISPALAWKRSNPLILLYHGISSTAVQPGRLRNHDSKHLSIKTFQLQLKTLSRLRRVITLRDMVDGLRNGEDMRNTVAITFDDGYENNFLHAAPVLADFNMGATFFLTTGFVGTERCAWTDRVEIMLDRTESASVAPPWLAQSLALDTFALRQHTLRKLKAELKQFPNHLCLSFVEELEDQLKVATRSAEGDYRFMSWNQARQLVNSGFDVGAHSVTHPILSKLPLDEAKHEILTSREMIFAELGQCSNSFAYPNGSFSDYTNDIVAFCREHFQAALSTNRGPADSAELFELRRLTSPEGPMASHIEWMLLREH